MSEFHPSVEEEESSSDYSQDLQSRILKIEQKKVHKEKRKNRDKAGKKKVTCKFCLDNSHTLKYMPIHVQKLHAEFF